MCHQLQAAVLNCAKPHDNPVQSSQNVLDCSTASEIIITNVVQRAPLPSERLNNVPANIYNLPWSTVNPPFLAEVQAAAQATKLEPALIHAVIAAESGYNDKALSRKGAFGLMQVMPATAKHLSTVPLRTWSASQQILWGSRYLKQLLDLFEGDVALALAAYNAGPAAVRAHHQAVPPFAETRQYVPKVLGYYQQFKSQLKRT